MKEPSESSASAEKVSKEESAEPVHHQPTWEIEKAIEIFLSTPLVYNLEIFLFN